MSYIEHCHLVYATSTGQGLKHGHMFKALCIGKFNMYRLLEYLHSRFDLPLQGGTIADTLTVVEVHFTILFNKLVIMSHHFRLIPCLWQQYYVNQHI